MADTLLGSFVWCELMTTDMKSAESFYSKVVGWKPVPFAPDGSYTVFNNAAGGVGGVMPLPDMARQNGTPPSWIMYLGTPNVDDTAMRIAQLGGRVNKQPAEIPNVGRFAIVQDPYGAMFALLQPKLPPGAPDRKRGGVGDFSWFELYTPNPQGAWKFYEGLFGWEKTSAMDMGEMGSYQMFGRGGGIPSGGIMKPPPGAPAAWQPYAMVKDAKEAAAIARVNGGTIVNGPMEVPGGDWIAVGTDPQGVMFAVHSLKPAVKAAAGVEGERQKAQGRREKAKGRRHKAKGKKAEGGRQKAKGRTQKAKGRTQKAKGRRQKAKGTRQKVRAASKKAVKNKSAKKKAAKKKAAKTARRKR